MTLFGQQAGTYDPAVYRVHGVGHYLLPEHRCWGEPHRIAHGKTVYGVPDFTAGLSLDYKIPQVEGLSVNGRATYVSKQYLTSDNKYEIPDFTIVDLGAKYATKIGGVATTFRANVNNIADKNYWSGVFNDAYAIVGEGRTYKLGVTFDF